MVAVRLRCLLQKEKELNRTKTVQSEDGTTVVLKSQQELSISGILPESATRGSASTTKFFTYDRVLPDHAAQHDVFEAACLPVIENVLSGENATVFAYGATSAGKTHTMLGSPTDPGVMVLTLQDLFSRIADFRQTNIRCSFIEIYNEDVRDLLSHYSDRSPSSTSNLDIREDPATGRSFIQGVTEIEGISEVEELMTILNSGNSRRTTEPTEANETSSRSHAILQVVVEQRQRDGRILVGKLSLIDLAGSERAKATKNRGIRFLEGGNINKSLLALGNCIQALSAGKTDFIPYRDSKLTRLLKDSLGGNCRTVLIANISPFVGHYRDTLNTLKFALKAKNVTMHVSQNSIVANTETEIENYKKIISQLEQMVENLQDQLSKAKTANRVSPFSDEDDNDDRTVSGEHVPTEWDLKRKLMSSITDQLEIRGRLANIDDMLDTHPQHRGLQEQKAQLLANLADINAEADTIQRSLNSSPKPTTESTINECMDIIDRIGAGRKQSGLVRNKSTTSLRHAAGSSSTTSSALEEKLSHLRTSLLELERVKIEKPESVPASRRPSVQLNEPVPKLQPQISVGSLLDRNGARSVPPPQEKPIIVQGRRRSLQEDIDPVGPATCLIKFN